MSNEEYRTYNMQMGGDNSGYNNEKKKVHPFVWVVLGFFIFVVTGILVCTVATTKIIDLGKDYIAEEITVSIRQAYNNPIDYPGEADEFEAMLLVVEDHLSDFNDIVENGQVEFDELLTVSDVFDRFYSDSLITIDEAETLLERIVIINEKHGR